MEIHEYRDIDSHVRNASPEHLNAFGSIEVLPPIAQELFFAGSGEETSILSIGDNPKLYEQSKKRRDLYRLFGTAFEAMSDQEVEIGQAIQNGAVSPNLAVDLWNGISDFLEEDGNNARLLLYLPFEVIPDLRYGLSEDARVASAADRFGDVYWESWIRLLHETESRANYTDGDILEPGLGEPERISKAGHLTPQLLEKGIISQDDVVNLFDILHDGVLLKSLAEGATVARGKDFISDDKWRLIEEAIQVKVGIIDRTPWNQVDINNPESEIISAGRARWLRKIKQAKIDNTSADQISQAILGGLSVKKVVEQNGAGNASVLGIIKAGCDLGATESPSLGGFIEESILILEDLWNSGDSTVKDSIVGGLHQWVRLGVVESEFLQRFGIRLIDLSAPSQFVEGEVREEFGYLVDAAEKIKNHELLSQSIYPGFLLFGSRTKGYANFDSDLDAAIFFKPNVQFSERVEIIKTLERDIPELEGKSLLEFWSELEGGKVRFKIPQEGTRIFVGEEQVHFLLGGIWISGEELIRVRSDILERYTDLSHLGDGRERTKELLLGLLELDAVQYRLMHRGYRKMYPMNKKDGGANSDLIDWDSSFWDPGFRRVATKLFLSKVYLPDLS